MYNNAQDQSPCGNIINIDSTRMHPLDAAVNNGLPYDIAHSSQVDMKHNDNNMQEYRSLEGNSVENNNPSTGFSHSETRTIHPNQKPKSDNAQVINLSDFLLNHATESTLRKGLNFAITLNKIPVEEVISNIEVAIKNLDIAKSEEIRQDITKILRTSKPPPSKITVEGKRALNNLRKSKNIVILKVD